MRNPEAGTRRRDARTAAAGAGRRPRRRRLLIGAGLLIGVALAGAALVVAGPGGVAGGSRGDRSRHAAADAGPLDGPGSGAETAASVAAAPEPAPSGPEASEELSATERLLREETIQQRLARLELEAQAKERFDDSLERSGITAREIEEGVKHLFETVTVEPVLLEGGRMDGLRIFDLPSGHPLDRAGLVEGDRLVRLNGYPLDDPAVLPDVLIRLRRSFEACVWRNGEELCTRVTVDAPG